MPKPNKALTKRAIVSLAPQYVEAFRDLQGRNGRLAFPSGLSHLQSKFGSYVTLYEDERRIGVALFIALVGSENFVALNKEIEAASEVEQQEFLDQVASWDQVEIDSLLDGLDLPLTDDAKFAEKARFDALPDDQKVDFSKRGALFWGFFFSSFFNALSLMVHGAKLTALVPQAITGNQDAFLKAVQIDRMLLIHHPYFRERKREAQERGDTAFLRKLLSREICPPLQSRLRYPGLYMLFGILEAFQWLNDMSHEEILDIVDAAGLDRYQNRVEDVNYLTKRLVEYRRHQRLGALSML